MMPAYDFRCKQCGWRFSAFYKTYADYDARQTTCPQCGSDQLAELVTRVTVAQPSRDYTKMDAHEMLGVLESGDARAVGEMFQQVGGGDPALGATYHETTQRLLKGETVDKIEKDLQSRPTGDAS